MKTKIEALEQFVNEHPGNALGVLAKLDGEVGKAYRRGIIRTEHTVENSEGMACVFVLVGVDGQAITYRPKSIPPEV
jgi:hypothetical protein